MQLHSTRRKNCIDDLLVGFVIADAVMPMEYNDYLGVERGTHIHITTNQLSVTTRWKCVGKKEAIRSPKIKRIPRSSLRRRVNVVLKNS
jgi:hypothetical protein